MRIASIDIGTNTILLLIADVDSRGIQKIILDQQGIARMGKGVDSARVISQETFRRVESFVSDYKKTCDRFSVEKIVATGTSALRDAKNSIDFCRYIFEKTGIAIEIISGDDEAQWTYRGGISEFLDRSEMFSVIDIGGGSTEIIRGNKKYILNKTSTDIGSVRITERILKNSPPTNASITEARQYIHSQIPKMIQAISSTFPVAVAGTATTLAALQQKLPVYDPGKVSGFQLTYQMIHSIFLDLRDRSIEQIKKIPQISEGRADIILAGIMILMGCMEVGSIERVIVSDRGLRYGILYREIEKYFTDTLHQ